MDYRLALMAGIDIPIPECQLILHQPTIKEIAYIGESNFFTGVQCLCLQKNMVIQDERLLESVSNFQIFMTIVNEKQTADKKADVISVLTVLFPDYKVIFTPRAIMFNNESGNFMIDEGNFENLQQVISEIFCSVIFLSITQNLDKILTFDFSSHGHINFTHCGATETISIF